MHKPACNPCLQDPTPGMRRHSTQASVSAVVGMRSCYGVGFLRFLGLLPYCQSPPMWSQWERSHVSPSLLVVFSQKMPNISTGFSVPTLSYCQVEPLLLANVPSLTLKHLCFATSLVSFPFRGRVPLRKHSRKTNLAVRVVRFTVCSARGFVSET